jgi:hypothetical protein
VERLERKQVHMKLAEWASQVDDINTIWRADFVRELPPTTSYSENDRFCQVFSVFGTAERKALSELEDYSLMNVQYWSDEMLGSDYDMQSRPALFSFQRKQKPDRNKATPWKLRSR